MQCVSRRKTRQAFQSDNFFTLLACRSLSRAPQNQGSDSAQKGEKISAPSSKFPIVRPIVATAPIPLKYTNPGDRFGCGRNVETPNICLHFFALAVAGRQNARHVKQLGRGEGVRVRPGARDPMGLLHPARGEKREPRTNGTLRSSLITPTGPAIPRRTSHGLLRDCDGSRRTRDGSR